MCEGVNDRESKKRHQLVDVTEITTQHAGLRYKQMIQCVRERVNEEKCARGSVKRCVRLHREGISREY